MKYVAKLRPYLLPCVVVLMAFGVAGAQNETPSSHVSVVVAPVLFEGASGEAVFLAETGDPSGQRYITLALMETADPGLFPIIDMIDHLERIDGTYSTGVLLHTGHGGDDGSIIMESFTHPTSNDDAKNACLARLAEYKAAGFDTEGDDIECECSGQDITAPDFQWSIYMFKEAVTNNSDGLPVNKPLVYIATCYGVDFVPVYCDNGARVGLGSIGCILTADVKQQVETFFKRMNGREGQLERPVARARLNLNKLGAVGDENTTLAPSVLLVYAPCPIMTGSKVYYLLDTRCSMGNIPDIIGYGCTIENEIWLDHFLLEGTCTAPPPPGSFAFGLRLKWDNLYSDRNTARLDGNTDPAGINAHGPAHDDHLSSFDCPPTRVNRHNQDGYRPPHGDPRGTIWHELYPNYCQTWELTSWIDGGDEKLSFCDFVDFTNTETGVVSWEHVIGVTTTIVVTDGRDTHYMEFMGENPDVEPIFEPIGTMWYEKWPGYSRQYSFEDWVDNGDGYLSADDDILLLSLSPPDEGAILEYQIVEVATDLTTTPIMVFKIEKTHNTIQGGHETVDVTMEYHPYEMGGFDFLMSYDASALGLQSAIPGPAFYDPAPDGCGWEYFTYRHGPFGNCGDACPSGMVRVLALAETNNGPNHPSCFLPDSLPATLFTLDFLVSNDRTLECMYVPIRFFWADCGDNSISSVDGELLYVSDHVYEFEGTDITDSTFGFPTYFGVQSECLNPDPDKPTVIQFVDFVNGGIDIVCADSIDDRGDINLNGVVNEVADAVLYSNYFVHGISVFNVNIDGQIAASDVNADGITLSVADLVYMIRIITGDALPYPKLTAITANADLVNGVLSVNGEMGAAYVVVERSITPRLLAESMEMKYNYDADHDLTRILVYSMDKGRRFAGDFLGGIDGNVITLEMATYEGAPVTTKLVPDQFALYPSYPNPFNPVTTISFALASLVDYELVIYNSLGQTVKTFSGHSGPGLERVDWNASGFASGVYFYRLTAGEFTDTKKMVLLK